MGWVMSLIVRGFAGNHRTGGGFLRAWMGWRASGDLHEIKALSGGFA